MKYFFSCIAGLRKSKIMKYERKKTFFLASWKKFKSLHN